MKPVDVDLRARTLRERGFKSKDIDETILLDEVVWILSEKFELFNQIYDSMIELEEYQDDGDD